MFGRIRGCPVCKNFEDANGDYIESLVREGKATVRFHVLSFLGDESVRAAKCIILCRR